MKPDTLSPGKTNIVTVTALLLGLTSLFFCSCGVLVAFSFPLGNVNIDSIDTRIFTPELSIMTGFCLWIPAIVTAVAAAGIWFAFGRTPLQRQLAQTQAELDHLRELTLQTYLDQIGELIMKKKLNHSDPDSSAVQFSQRRTRETLGVLDRQRQQKLLQYLNESQLIGEQGVLHVEQDNLLAAAV